MAFYPSKSKRSTSQLNQVAAFSTTKLSQLSIWPDC